MSSPNGGRAQAAKTQRRMRLGCLQPLVARISQLGRTAARDPKVPEIQSAKYAERAGAGDVVAISGISESGIDPQYIPCVVNLGPRASFLWREGVVAGAKPKSGEIAGGACDRCSREGGG